MIFRCFVKCFVEVALRWQWNRQKMIIIILSSLSKSGQFLCSVMNVWELRNNRKKITHIHRSCYYPLWHTCPSCFSPNRPCTLSIYRCYRWHILLGMQDTPFSSYRYNNHQDSCWDTCPRANNDSAYKGCTESPMSRCRKCKMNGSPHNCEPMQMTF